MKFKFGFLLPVLAIYGAMGLIIFGQSHNVLTNADVISLTQAGVAKTVIVERIKGAQTSFDLSTDKLIELKKAGVDDDVVLAMITAKGGKSSGALAGQKAAEDFNDPLAPHPHGIYFLQTVEGVDKMIQLFPSVSGQNRKDGLITSKLTHGITKVRIKAKLPGARSNVETGNAAPVFYFYLDTDSGGMNTASGIPATTREFALVKFEIKDASREITISEANPFLQRGGVPDKYIIGFVTEKIAEGIFRVTPERPLAKGEYAFYLINSGNSNTTVGGGAKFFDFRVN